MNDIKAGDLAFIVKGLWPNVGRVVYVAEFVPDFDFSPMGLSIRQGWRVRSWGHGPLQRTDGLHMVGNTPLGSLRRLEPLPPKQKREIKIAMAMEDFNDALKDLARYFAVQEALKEV